MANITSVFQDALADQAKAALIQVVSANPKTTVKELRKLVSDTPALGAMTLNELLGESAGGKRKGRGGRKRKAAATSGGKRKGGVQKRNVRTEAGRDAFDAEVLAALKDAGGKDIAATTIRQAINAEPTQLRTSLNRLIEKGLVTFTGKARGTRYTLV